EDLDLLGGVDGPLDEVVGLLDVLALLGDRPERATPVTATARDRGDVPLALLIGRDLLDVTEHPRRAGEDSEVTVDEALVPAGGEARQVGRQASLVDLHGGVERDLRATVHLQLLARVVEADRLLRQDRVEDVGGVVYELLLGLSGVLLADVDE